MNSRTILSFFYHFVFLAFTIFTLGSSSKSQKSFVKNLELSDLNESLLLYDGFPVYFNCKFQAFNKNYSILFKRIEYPNRHFTKYSHLLEEFADKNLFRSYESVFVDSLKVYRASSVLFLNVDTFEVFSKIFFSNYINFSTNWLKLQTNTNLIKRFDILIKLFEIDEDKSNHDLLISIGFDLFDSFQGLPKRYENLKIPNEYIAYSNQIQSLSNTFLHQKRNLNKKRAKNKLVVESCVHIHENVFSKIKNYLLTNDMDYIRMYISLHFSNVIYNVNKIYQSISDLDISIAVELVEIVIHTQYANNQLDLNNKFSYFMQTSKFVNEYYMKLNQSDKCDHVFYVHGYEIGNTLGQAIVGQICNHGDHHHTSIHLYLPYSDIIFAHELGHNLGSYHDTLAIGEKFKCNFKSNQLMHSNMQFNYSVRTFSKCSIKQFKVTLLDQNMSLKPEFKCLTINNNPIRYHTEIISSLPGYYYSLSDQCRIILNNSKSYVCETYKNECNYLSCAFNGNCVGKQAPLDGSYCGFNKICLYFECINPFLSFPNLNGQVFTQALTFKYPDIFEKASELLRNYCPLGTTQELNAVNYPVPEKYGFHLITKYKQCDTILSNRDITDLQHVCTNHHIVNLVCCERCIKFNFKKCFRQPCNNVPTCETLGSNPCFNDGKCVTNISLVNSDTADVAFSCECPKSFKGPLCLEFDPCSLNPCHEYELCRQFGELRKHECLCSRDHSQYPYCNKRKYILRLPLNLIILFIFIVMIIFIKYFTRKKSSNNF